jgi:hypothetical protein
MESPPVEVGEKIMASVTAQKVDRMSPEAVDARPTPGTADEVVMAPVAAQKGLRLPRWLEMMRRPMRGNMRKWWHL